MNAGERRRMRPKMTPLACLRLGRLAAWGDLRIKLGYRSVMECGFLACRKTSGVGSGYPVASASLSWSRSGVGVQLERFSTDKAKDYRPCTSGFVWRPVGLTQSDHAAVQGSPRRNGRVRCVALPLGCRVEPLGRSAGCHPCSPTQSWRPCVRPFRRSAFPAGARSL